MRKSFFCGLLAILVLGLFACGDDEPPQTEPPPTESEEGFEEILETLGGNEEEVSEQGFTIEVVSATTASSLTTASYDAVRPVMMEVDGRTSTGGGFRALMVGPQAQALEPGFKGEVLVRGRLVKVRDADVFVGVAKLVEGDGVFSFLAASNDTDLSGPEVGRAHHFDGRGLLRGFCSGEEVVGTWLFRDRLETTRIINAGVALSNGRFSCDRITLVESDLRVNLEGEVVETRLGKVLQGYGAVEVSRGQRAWTLPVFTIGIPEKLTERTELKPSEAEAADNVIILDPMAASELEEVRDGTMYFRRLPPNMEGVKVGDTLVARPYPRMPQGLLRRVTGVTTGAEGTAIQTEPGRLEDLFQEGGFSFERRLGLEDIEEDIMPVEGVDFTGLNPGPQMLFLPQALTLIPRVTIRKQVIPGLDIVGYIDLDVTPVFSFACTRLCAQSEVIGKFVVTQQTKLGLEGEGEIRGLKSIQLGPPIRLGTFIVPAGPIPITITPAISFHATVSGSGRIDITTSVTHDLNMEIGIEKPFGEGFRGVNEFHRELTFDPPSFEGSFSAQARVAIKASVSVLGLSAFADLGPYVELTVQVPGNPTWSLDGGISSYAGLEYDLWLISGGTQMEIFNRSWNVSTSPNIPPTITSLDIISGSGLNPLLLDDLLAEITDKPRIALNTPITVEAIALDPEDASCCRMTWTLTRPTGALSRINTNLSEKSATFDTPILGDYELTVEVFDSLNASSTATLSFEVVESAFLESLVEVDLEKTSAGTPSFGEEVMLRARTLKSDDPTCCTLNWRISRPVPATGDEFDVGVSVFDTWEVIEEFQTTTTNSNHNHTFRARNLLTKVEVVPSLGSARLGFDPFTLGMFTRTLEVPASVLGQNSPPEITGFEVLHPTTSSIVVGEPVSFIVQARDDEPGMTFRMRHDGEVFAEGPLNGYAIAPYTFSSSGIAKTVEVRVEDSDGEVTTGSTTVRVVDLGSGIGSPSGFGF